jgi:hypothetical protein
MSVYYGVVRDNHIELEGDAHLANGTRVVVHVAPPVDHAAAAEETAKARLRAAGLLAPALESTDVNEDEEFEPMVVRGEPLSEQVIRERR